MNDEECLELYDRMQRLDGERSHKKRLEFVKRWELTDDKCPRCGSYLVLNQPTPISTGLRVAPCYCSGCAWCPEVNK